MARKKEKKDPLYAPDKKPLDETLPRGEAHFPPSRMDPDGGWTGNPLDVTPPEQKKKPLI